MQALARRSALAVFALALVHPAHGSEPAVSLFRIVTQRDTVTVGLTAAERAPLGPGETVTLLAAKLQRDGQVTLWQCASGRAADGSLAMRPMARIAVLRADALRIEPYAAALPIIAP